MLIVIVGVDRVGTRLAKKFIEQDYDVIVLEKNIEKANIASNNLDCLVINSDGTNLDDLRKAGISKAEYFIALTGSDERNMIACGLVSREFGIPNKIARVKNIFFSNANFLENAFLGIDYIINPSTEAAKYIVSGINHGALSDIMVFQGLHLQMRNMSVLADSIFENKKLSELPGIIPDKFLIALIMRNNKYIIPKGDTIIKELDNLYLVGTEESLDSVFSKLGKNKIEIKKIVIIGGSDIAQLALDYMLGKNESQDEGFFLKFTSVLKKAIGLTKNITVIDKNYEICKQLSAKYPEISVINADIADEGVFEEEELINSDLIITCTYNQELNIVTAVYAKSLGIKRSIALVGKTSYIGVALNLGIDIPISLNNSMVQGILRFIKNEKLKSFYSIPNSDIEIIQFTTTKESALIGKTIREIDFPYHSLIISVKRGDEEILPDGNYSVQAEDTVIMIARRESIKKLENMFTK